MADEYIRRGDALEITTRTCGDYAAAWAEIRKLPAADVVEVVRCKDCANATQGRDNEYRCIFSDTAVYTAEHYCAFGEKKCGQNSNDG